MAHLARITLTDLTLPISIGEGMAIPLKLAGAVWATCHLHEVEDAIPHRVTLDDGGEFVDPARVDGLVNNGLRLCFYGVVDVTDYVDTAKIAKMVRADRIEREAQNLDAQLTKRGL